MTCYASLTVLYMALQAAFQPCADLLKYYGLLQWQTQVEVRIVYILYQFKGLTSTRKSDVTDTCSLYLYDDGHKRGRL